MKGLKRWSTTRLPWFLLLLVSWGVIGGAYYIQLTYPDQQPCFYCIMDRWYLFVTGVAALVGLVWPRFFLTRFLAIALWLYGSVSLLANGIGHYRYALDTNPFATCPTKADLPLDLASLDFLAPIFTAVGNCKSLGMEVWGFSLTHWGILVAGVLTLVALLVAVSQFYSLAKPRLLKDQGYSL